MTTLTDRPASALLVIDVQHKVMQSAHDREAVVANIGRVVARARGEGAPVVWVQHDDDENLARGSDAWRIVDELDPRTDEPVIEKRWGDAFEATGLEALLAQLKVGRLIIAGAQTDACIRCTLHGALARGYDVILVGDAHSTEDLSKWGAPPPDQVIRHLNLCWAYQTAPGRTAGVASADVVAFLA
ncbi:MAG TPA: isochorismatase family protein [Caulobacteraceae bacterium]|jgi:nicotinamidase-related amidase|nr:isochorismatase family protein [Caulobacteraceae bacterium]